MSMQDGPLCSRKSMISIQDSCLCTSREPARRPDYSANISTSRLSTTAFGCITHPYTNKFVRSSIYLPDLWAPPLPQRRHRARGIPSGGTHPRIGATGGYRENAGTAGWSSRPAPDQWPRTLVPGAGHRPAAPRARGAEQGRVLSGPGPITRQNSGKMFASFGASGSNGVC
jgi:hypothetical protein